jgi:hypothetical protein
MWSTFWYRRKLLFAIIVVEAFKFLSFPSFLALILAVEIA